LHARRRRASRARPLCASRARGPSALAPQPPLSLSSARPSAKTPGIFWASSVAGTLAFQWSKPIPTSLRIIHARVYAQVRRIPMGMFYFFAFLTHPRRLILTRPQQRQQAFTLAALGLAAAVDVYEHKAATARELDAMSAKVRAIEARVKSDS
jgi:hypothetical protein